MPGTRVADVLAEVFRTYGFDTTTDAHPDAQSGTTYQVDLIAQRDGVDVVITIHEGPVALDLDRVDGDARLARDVAATYHVVVGFGGFTEAAHAHARRVKSILWDRAAVEAVIGKAVLHEAVGPLVEDAPIAEVLAYGRVPDAEPAAPIPPAASDPAASDPAGSSLPVAAALHGEQELADPAADLSAAFGLFDAPEAEAAPAVPVPTAGPDAVTPAESPVDLFAFPPNAESAPTAETETNAVTPEGVATGPAATLFDPGSVVPAAHRTVAATGPSPPPSQPVSREQTERTQGRGWILEESTPQEPAAATLPPAPPVPSTPSVERPNLATMMAMGGVDRVPRHRGPDPRVFNPPEGSLLAPNVSKERAAATARDKIYTIDNTRLRYHPMRVFRWSVEAFVEGQVTTTTLTGVCVVDLATREVHAPSEWKASRSLREGTFDVPVDHKPIRMELDRAREIVLDAVLEDTAREITVEDHDATLDIMVTEKRRVRAAREDVRLDDEGLQWAPIWCFTGVNGEVEVEGLGGDVRGARLKASEETTMLL